MSQVPINVGDPGYDPLYPFGFGLSYGQVAYSNLALSATEIGPDDTVEATFELRNTSSRAVEEVAS